MPLPTFALHPAHRLACWLLIVVAMQSLAGIPLLLTFVLVPLLGRACLLRWVRLLRRARWLLLALLLVLAWGVAGEAIWEDGLLLAPTREGLLEGGTQLARLVLVLAAVAALLETTPIPQLMAGVHGLLRPLAVFGVEVDRAVVRLSLALHYAERASAKDWRHVLAPQAATGPGVVHLHLSPAGWHDWLALLVVAGLAAGVCLA